MKRTALVGFILLACVSALAQEQEALAAPVPDKMPSLAHPSAQSAQETKGQQSAQKPAAEPLKQAPAFGLEDGTPVKLRLTRNLSSADAKAGDQVDFEVLEDIKVKDVIVIPRGGIAWATVTEAQRKRRMGRGGKLNVNIDDVRLVDGEKAPLRAVKESQGGGHVGAMTGAIVATTIVFFPAAPLFLFIHGKDINIPKGTEITAYINGDIPLDPSRFQNQAEAKPGTGETSAQAPPGATRAKSEPPPQTQAASAEVSVESKPVGAEIEVDGSFVGSTPSTFSVSPGDHTIVVRKAGYKPWERRIKVTGGKIAISAELEADVKQEQKPPDPDP
jgi:hypothetical protein